MRILSDNELFFPSPSRFNDPFDSKIPISFQSDSRAEIINYWTDGMRLLEPTWSEEERRARVERLYDLGKLSESELNAHGRFAADCLAEQHIGVYSLACSVTNILLWSHYADSHSGFAVGFNTPNLFAACTVSLARHHEPMLLLPVQYTVQFPVINGYRDSNERKFRTQLLSKAIDWEYEREYRILLKEGVDATVNFPNEVFKRVVLGCNISKQNRAHIIEILHQRRDHLSLYEAHPARSSFSLTFTAVEY